MSSSLRFFADVRASLRPTVGDTKTNAITTDHMGWLYCNGRALNTADFPQLFNVIGYSFGGSGSTFYLPDPQGRVPGFVGQANGPGPNNVWELGDISGEETHHLLLSEVPAHNHNDISGSPGVTSTADGVTSPYTHSHGGNTGVSGEHTHTSNAVGGNGQPGIALFNNTNTPGSIDDSSNEINNVTTSALTINPNGNHTHTIAPDTHTHTIASNGGDERHNNIQPTIWIGNLFIFSGRQWAVATAPSRPLKGANPVPNSNRYRTQGPPINLY